MVLVTKERQVLCRFFIVLPGDVRTGFIDHFRRHDEMIITIILHFDLSCSKEAPVFKEFCEVDFAYITANTDELELITNGIISPSSIGLFTHFLHNVCIEVRVAVFREEQVQLPERHETVEDVWVLEIGNLWLRLNDRFSCFGIVVLAGEAAWIAHLAASVHRKYITTYFSHSAPSDLRS